MQPTGIPGSSVLGPVPSAGDIEMTTAVVSVLEEPVVWSRETLATQWRALGLVGVQGPEKSKAETNSFHLALPGDFGI